jgi:HdeA/HdeB family
VPQFDVTALDADATRDQPCLGDPSGGVTVRIRTCVALCAVLAAAGGPSAHGLDFSKVTCRAFLGSGQANMAAMFMWLRGYHAGKNGVIAYDSASPYAARLGRYCRDHSLANLIEASERILADLDRDL